jgi:ubiquinone/menaquinone biosynthesis C-methylase UbiE
MRIYRDLAKWYPLITAPPGYAEEAAHIAAAIEFVCDGPAETLLELGAGAGANASHLKARFRCTLTDLSPEMLSLSRAVNPECEHIIGDMRELRLDRLFDAVLIHDAIGYMASEADLRAAIETASRHLRPGGAALFIPDDIRDGFQSRTDQGGTDGPDRRSLRYLMWTPEPPPDATAIETHFALLIAEQGKPVRCEHDVHTTGLFPRALWHRLIDDAGLDLIDLAIPDPHEGEHTVFAARKRRL